MRYWWEKNRRWLAILGIVFTAIVDLLREWFGHGAGDDE